MRYSLPVRKAAALLAAGAMTFSTLAGGQGASEEYQAHCRDLQQRITAVKTDMVKGILPQEDPSRFLSTMSCLDNILSMQFNFGLRFSIDAFFSKFLELITNRICGQVTGSWNNLMGWVNRTVGTNVSMPWGPSESPAVPPVDYGGRPAVAPMSPCTVAQKEAALSQEMRLDAYPSNWTDSHYRMRSPPIWVAGAKGVDRTGAGIYPAYAAARVRGYQLLQDVFTWKFTTLRDADTGIDITHQNIAGTDPTLPKAHWISECPGGEPVPFAPDGTTPNKCFANLTNPFGGLRAATGPAAVSGGFGSGCMLAKGKTYYANFAFMDEGKSFRQPPVSPPPNADGIVLYPTNIAYDWRIVSCFESSGCNFGPTGPLPTGPQPKVCVPMVNVAYTNEFVTNNQKIVRRVPPGRAWATSFVPEAGERILVSTTETLLTPTDLEHEVSVSECLGDFTDKACTYTAQYNGSSIVMSAESLPPRYISCHLVPGRTYYMNYRAVTRTQPRFPTCKDIQGCEQRVQINRNQLGSSCPAITPAPVGYGFAAEGVTGALRLPNQVAAYAPLPKPSAASGAGEITFRDPNGDLRGIEITIAECQGFITSIYGKCSAVVQGGNATIRFLTKPTSSIKDAAAAEAAGYCWAPEFDSNGFPLNWQVNVRYDLPAPGSGTTEVTWRSVP